MLSEKRGLKDGPRPSPGCEVVGSIVTGREATEADERIGRINFRPPAIDSAALHQDNTQAVRRAAPSAFLPDQTKAYGRLP